MSYYKEKNTAEFKDLELVIFFLRQKLVHKTILISKVVFFRTKQNIQNQAFLQIQGEWDRYCSGVPEEETQDENPGHSPGGSLVVSSPRESSHQLLHAPRDSRSS